MIARYFLFLSFIFFLFSFLALFAWLLGALIHSAAVAAVCSAQQGTGSSLALIPTRIAAVWLSVVLDRINSKLADKKTKVADHRPQPWEKNPKPLEYTGKKQGCKRKLIWVAILTARADFAAFSSVCPL